ncbi:MAG: ferritin-like domain-containing protein [Candidatus Zixiibacteriota bacterium]
MFGKVKDKKKLVSELNKALGWELRAEAMYAHYSVYVGGLSAVQLKSHFEEEAKESFGHAAKVREIIALLGGQAVTNRDATPIVHTAGVRDMLAEALKTETAAAQQYQKALPLVGDHPVIKHDLMHIMMDEMRAVDELENLLGE